MNTVKIIDDFLNKYGNDIKVDNIGFKGIISSRHNNTPEFLRKDIETIGTNIIGDFILLCPPCIKVLDGQVVSDIKFRYKVMSSSIYYVGNIPIYRVAIMQILGGLV